ncbi:MAG: hypothetical protein U0935_04170 [Pirellulales bacterium]
MESLFSATSDHVAVGVVAGAGTITFWSSDARQFDDESLLDADDDEDDELLELDPVQFMIITIWRPAASPRTGRWRRPPDWSEWRLAPRLL